MAEIIRKATIGNKLFVILTIITILIFCVSWLCPPTGEVHDSVLKGMGILFAFAALATFRDALIKGVDAKFTKGDTSIEINNPNKEEDDHNS